MTTVAIHINKRVGNETFPPEGVSISLSDGEPDVEERSFLLTNLPL